MSNTVIAIRSSGVASNIPSLGVLANGEIALNYADGIIYYKTDANTLGQIKTTEPSGLDTEIQFNDSGSFGSNASLTFEKNSGLLITKNLDSEIVSAINVSTDSIVTGTYIQFGDGSRQYTANAGDAGLADQYARDHANGAFDAANTSQTTADGAYTHANGAFDTANTNATTDFTNVSITAGDYGSAVIIPVVHLEANGRVSSVTNTSITSGTTSDAGIVQLTDATNSTSTTTAATPNSVKSAYDLADTANTNAATAQSTADDAQTHAEGAFTQANTNSTTDYTAVSITAGDYGSEVIIPVVHLEANGRVSAVANTSVRAGSTSVTGIVQLTDATNSTSTTTAATPNAVKSAYDLADTANTNAATAQSTADGAQTHAEGAFTQANTNASNITTAQNTADGAQTHAEGAFTQANGAFDAANTAQTTADGAYAHANGAFDSANTKFASAGGTVSGFVDVTQNVSVGSYVDLNTAPSNPTHSEGRLFYDNTQKSLAYYNEDSEMTLQIGQETVVRVYNKSGDTINNASVVRITGSDGAGFPAISLADATSAVNSEVIGITTTEIANDSYGYVTTDGKVGGVDTSLLSDGAELFLSTTPGEYTTTVPATPNIAQAVGYVSSVGASGSILVNLHPMTGRNMTDGSIIFAENGGFDQDNADLYWDNTNHRLGINTNTPSANLHVVGTGLFTGNVEILGNLIITNAEAITTTTLNVGGNTIVLSDEVSGEPTVNAEIVINRGSSDNVSIRWDETTDEWVLIEASGVEGHILSDAKTFQSWNDYATAETYEKAGYPIGADLANATHEQAVTANNLAALAQAAGQGGYDHANGAFTAANTAQSTADGAQTHAEGAFTQANTNATNITTNQTTAGNAYNHANGAFDLANGTAGVANTDVTNVSVGAGTYGNSTTATSITLAANGRITAISTETISGGGGTITLDTAPPASGNSVGDIWIDANTGVEFTYINDGDSSQWIELGISGYLVGSGSVGAVFDHANAAFDAANTAQTHADGAFDLANTAITTTNSSSSDVQFDSFGVGTAASGTTGEIRATNQITAYYSDKRLKDIKGNITNALEKVNSLSGIYYINNDVAETYGYTNKDQQVGVIAQEVEHVLPEIVKAAPFDIGQNEDGTEYSLSGENFKTVQYEKLSPLFVEAIKELNQKIIELENQVKELKKG